jgi:hypothetical protein
MNIIKFIHWANIRDVNNVFGKKTSPLGNQIASNPTDPGD